MSKTWDYKRLFADLDVYIGKPDYLKEMASDKNLLENYVYEDGLSSFDDKINMEAGYNAYVERFMYVESLTPESERIKVIFGLPVKESLYHTVKFECEANAFNALKEMWLDLLERERKLLKESNNIPTE